MIIVKVERNTQLDDKILAFEVKGHADFDVHGKDIVCAAVSAITIGTVNAIEKIACLTLKPNVSEGFLSLDLQTIHNFNEDQEKKTQLLLESMIVMLQTIQDSYREYISIHYIFRKGG
jgi:uncharacterized protein YsxB (DUF464 family)